MYKINRSKCIQVECLLAQRVMANDIYTADLPTNEKLFDAIFADNTSIVTKNLRPTVSTEEERLDRIKELMKMYFSWEISDIYGSIRESKQQVGPRNICFV